jgi:carbon monoxide dehydrogenase subunit G
MTVRVTRTFEFDAPAERIWAFISDPAKRAEAISVVDSYELDPADDTAATWNIRLPIPLVTSTVSVETEDVVREGPRHVKFVGRSRVMRVVGEHTIEPAESGCRLVNEFVVDGKLPGVERFFERNLDAELDNLEAALREYLAVEQ